LAWLDPGRLPEGCNTLGELAEKTAILSYGILIEQGADARADQLWRVLVSVLAGFSGLPPGEINRHTYFLQSTFDKTKTAA